MSSILIKTYSYNRDFYRKIIIQRIKYQTYIELFITSGLKNKNAPRNKSQCVKKRISLSL